MFSGNRLKQIREAMSLTQADLARQLGISRTSYHNWEQGKTKPNQTNLNKLATIFDVEINYFEKEYELLSLYTKLHDVNQQKMLSYGENLLTYQQKEATPALFEYHVYEKLSAGTGYGYFDDHSYDVVYFEEEKEHDLASWVYGDSMEPRYPNGSVVLIRGTGFDYDGEVYAVDWDGQTYLKRVYREEEGLRLVSLNTKYQDKLAPYNEEPRIIGKVIDHFVPKERV
ncbi:helix-turn-helix transcriptional regulator [Aerococcaceae bacterium DSM 111022]|nr:helix-turn-helix transcriptional regulator [Aerococcaceae bacterium DSM 111022]